jgi:biotin-(acetyl-CoA carboxylase) ligase
VLVGESKIAGVLTHTSWRKSEVGAIIYGLGLNVEVAPTIAADPAVHSATSLATHLPGARLSDYALPLIRALQTRTQEWTDKGPSTVLDTYREYSQVIGREVEVLDDPRSGTANPPRILRRGRVVRIEDDLALVLEPGPSDPISKGRLRLLPDTRP